MNFIRLISQGPNHAFFNMALDEAISEAVRIKLSPPTLRFYQWDRPSLSIGYFQRISDINISYCNEKDYPVVRRLTGGRAILHDSELTYSFSSSSDHPLFKGGLHENYSLISNALVYGLKLVGMDAKSSFRKKRSAGHKNPACFKSVSYGEIAVNGKKIIGSAQKRYSNGFMQHGSILMKLDAGALRNTLFESSEESFSEIGTISEHLPDVTVDMLKASLKEAFEKKLKVKLVSDKPAQFELDLAKKLEADKYASEKWNYKK